MKCGAPRDRLRRGCQFWSFVVFSHSIYLPSLEIGSLAERPANCDCVAKIRASSWPSLRSGPAETVRISDIAPYLAVLGDRRISSDIGM